jgi:hypothetical protein
MQKTLQYTVAGICADVDGVSAAITRATRQPSGPYRVRGVLQADERVYVLLLPAPQGPPETYRFIEVCDRGEDELVALLSERWAAGFDAIGSVAAGDGLLLVLFARAEVPA